MNKRIWLLQKIEWADYQAIFYVPKTAEEIRKQRLEISRLFGYFGGMMNDNLMTWGNYYERKALFDLKKSLS